MPRVLHPDPFNAILVDSQALEVSDEQQGYIREVLRTACSDDQFAEKAYNAIKHILTSIPIVPATISSLNPSTATVGDPSFTLQVMGSGFIESSVIMFNGLEEPTTFVSDSELTTDVNMSVWLAAAVVPISVLSAGVVTDSLDFTFVDSGAGGFVAGKKKEEVGFGHPVFTRPEDDRTVGSFVEKKSDPVQEMKDRLEQVNKDRIQ